jgi:hypothetical protein
LFHTIRGCLVTEEQDDITLSGYYFDDKHESFAGKTVPNFAVIPEPSTILLIGLGASYGGEKDVARRVHAELPEVMEADWFESSTAEFLGQSFRSRFAAPFAAIHNSAVSERVQEAQRERGYVAWEIHNVFPALSPSVYTAAFELDVPIVHFLHNYRLGCVNGQFLNHGTDCTRCIDGNFWPAVRTVCCGGV